MTTTELIETAPHEFIANYNYDDGLDLYFACDSIVKDSGGSDRVRFEREGEQWSVRLYYQESNIVHPGETTPTGTPFQLDEIREFRLAVEAVESDDKSGQRSFNVHIRPRWRDMRVENKYGSESPMTHPLREGVNLKIQGSNIEFLDYMPILSESLESLGITSQYLDNPHDSSNVQQAERYVRVHEDQSGPIHARDGPLARCAHLLENDREGRRSVEQTDVAEDGEKVPGYRHQVGLDEERVQEIFPNHRLPKRVKHYRARQSHNLDSNNPLRHPKVGAIYYGSLWRDKRETYGVSDTELRQLNEELEEMLLSVLHDAGIDVTSAAPFVSDDYFEAECRERQRQVVDLPVEEIKNDQESVVIRHLSTGLSPVEWESLNLLVTDGGEVSPSDIAQEGGFHEDSVYRALDRIDELVEREYGKVALVSDYVAELVHTAITDAKQRVSEAVEAGAKAIDAVERGLDRETSAWVAFASQYCENVRKTDEGVKLELGTIKAETDTGELGSHDDAMREVRKRLREGKRLWQDMNNDIIDWRMGEWSATLVYDEVSNMNMLTRETRTFTGGRIWKTR